MYLVALAWMYVVLMMAVVEAGSPQGTVLGAFFTFVLYGVLPLTLVLYLLGTPGRRRARRRSESESVSEAVVDPDGRSHATGDAVAPKREEA
jgi:membrane protein implicated in regulation of membrane protease activity